VAWLPGGETNLAVSCNRAYRPGWPPNERGRDFHLRSRTALGKSLATSARFPLAARTACARARIWRSSVTTSTACSTQFADSGFMPITSYQHRRHLPAVSSRHDKFIKLLPPPRLVNIDHVSGIFAVKKVQVRELRLHRSRVQPGGRTCLPAQSRAVASISFFHPRISWPPHRNPPQALSDLDTAETDHSCPITIRRSTRPPRGRQSSQHDRPALSGSITRAA